ncbi:hypothetical protein SARC_07938 [Sphaeroforma arctica JP610]|uniref:Uncharacterized protein n=1 Tax=Sphaeroforma arctica JP610 TaxID=667725 RepID=A0A0L0FSL6_9EUKA|nr:hypothetical protein SARC_07938 [Sphaeroforma arctica JP610]KNC79674.1 hypothetical protein SARC_07938 [Sphaeroforma arctica JP610]|eukprot:XP_014153576.1 hypothetical protein SARC_07938 [Sphaeroforma arctica JP610]
MTANHSAPYATATSIPSGSIAESASSTAPDTQPTSSTAPPMPDYLFQQQAAIAFGIGLPQAPEDSPPIPTGAPAGVSETVPRLPLTPKKRDGDRRHARPTAPTTTPSGTDPPAATTTDSPTTTTTHASSAYLMPSPPA